LVYENKKCKFVFEKLKVKLQPLHIIFQILGAQKEEAERKDGVLKNYLHFHGFDSRFK
jgi:hypothetical protein